MKAELSTLFRLTEEYVEPASRILARAYYDAPSFVYQIPDASERKGNLRYLFEYAIRYGVLFGEVYSVSSDLEGIAGWIPFKKVFPTVEDQVKSGGPKVLKHLGREFTEKRMHLNDFFESMHKCNASFPHLYLYPFGITPEFKGKGYGNILLKAMFKKIDQDNLPVYLDTDTIEDVRFLQTHGFKVMEESFIPNTNVRIWAMLRRIYSINMDFIPEFLRFN